MDSLTNVLNCLCCLLRLAVVSGGLLTTAPLTIPSFESFSKLFGDLMVVAEEFDCTESRDLRLRARWAFVVTSLGGSYLKK